jgi:hypothetical protein
MLKTLFHAKEQYIVFGQQIFEESIGLNKLKNALILRVGQ